VRLVVASTLIAALAILATAAASPAPSDPRLRVWQATRVVWSHAALQQRPDFRIESTRRVNRFTVRVCWSEPGHLSPLDGRDHGCDVVQLRDRAFWLRGSSVLGGRWIRWL
jgi:hypothetical protein